MIRPARKVDESNGHYQPLPSLGVHMLANDNWGGQMPPELRALRTIEILMLQWMRPLRRRFFMNNHSGGIGMPATFGSSVVAPCATGIEQALRWCSVRAVHCLRVGECGQWLMMIHWRR